MKAQYQQEAIMKAAKDKHSRKSKKVHTDWRLERTHGSTKDFPTGYRGFGSHVKPIINVKVQCVQCVRFRWMDFNRNGKDIH